MPGAPPSASTSSPESSDSAGRPDPRAAARAFSSALAANVVPVLFRRAGSQTVMPPVLAIAAVTTTGYAGILLGPAIIGFVADHVGLTLAFWMIPVMVLSVPLCVAVVAPRRR